MKRLRLSAIRDPALRRQAAELDRLGGQQDGAIDSREVLHALQSSRALPDLRENRALGRSLRAMKALLAQEGDDVVVPRGAAARLSPLGVQLMGVVAEQAPAAGDVLYLASPAAEGRFASRFDVPKDRQAMGDGARVLVPLEDRTLHVIELQFRDRRKLAQQQFICRDVGTQQWRPFSGADWFAMKKREERGEIEIMRESEHNAPIIDNPMFVDATIIWPDGDRLPLGDKRIEFHVHAMKHKNQRGYVELDVINRVSERLPDGELPPGTTLELTVGYQNRDAFHDPDGAHAELQFVRPTYVPDHRTKKTVFESNTFETIPADGYRIDKRRKVQAIAIEWSDDISNAEGQISFRSNEGEFKTDLLWVSSGETELIDARGLRCTDGRLHIGGKNAGEIKVRKVEVFYE